VGEKSGGKSGGRKGFISLRGCFISNNTRGDMRKKRGAVASPFLKGKKKGKPE